MIDILSMIDMKDMIGMIGMEGIAGMVGIPSMTGMRGMTDMTDIPDMTDAISAGRQAKDRITDFWCRCGLWFFCRITCVAIWLCVSIQVDSL